MEVPSERWSGAGEDELLALVLERFGEVLDDDDLPADVAFTALGGSSLDGTVVCALLGEALGFSVSLSQLAAHPTAREFARLLARLNERSEERSEAEADTGARAGSTDETVPLTSMQISFLTQQAVTPGDRTPRLQFAWILTGPLDVAALRHALQDLHERHEPLGSRYLMRRRSAVAEPGAVTTVDVLHLPDADSELAALDATRTALDHDLDLASGQVWRVALARVTGHDVHVLRILVHHIAFDGMSEAVLVKDLGYFYAAHRGSRKVKPEPLAGMAQRARAREHQLRLNEADLTCQLAYWAGELADTPPLVFPGGQLASPNGLHSEPVRRTTTFPSGWLDAVDALATGHRTTRFAVLLTLYDRTLAEVTGQTVYGVGFPITRRWDALTSGVIDCCVDTLCLRMPPETRYGVRDFADAVQATGNRLAEAFSAADVPFADIVRAVNPPRDKRAPLYQNMLALQDYDRPDLALPDVTSRRIDEPYLGLPAELHVEIVPHRGGETRVAVSHLPGAVPERFAEDFHTALIAHLDSLPT
jgi:hypothetical protein